jgi:hypothetical protein
MMGGLISKDGVEFDKAIGSLVKLYSLYGESGASRMLKRETK